MTPSTLKARYLERHPKSQFFSPGTMRHFGDTMSNYGCRLSNYELCDGRRVAVWELYRKQPVKFNLTTSAYFTLNFDLVR